jgi:hypothetical protein
LTGSSTIGADPYYRHPRQTFSTYNAANQKNTQSSLKCPQPQPTNTSGSNSHSTGICENKSTICGKNATTSVHYSPRHISTRETPTKDFTTVFAPSIKYSLPVTSIPPEILQNIQKSAVNSDLPRLGYNKHMPRSVVFATKSRGGIGLLNLSTEQGASQVQLLISNLRARSYLYDTILILIETYQLMTGTSTSPFLDTTHRCYIVSPWIQSIQLFLKSINGTIYLPDISHITKNRSNDQLIMKYDTNPFSKSEWECINACRIFLQVNFLSEISNDQGTEILRDAVKGTVDDKGKPLLWTISISKLRWPHQPRPSTTAWNHWKKFLQHVTNPTFQIQTPLGPWTNTAHTQRIWQFTRHQNTILHVQQATTVVFTRTESRTRTQRFQRTITQPPSQSTALLVPVIPQHIINDKLTCHHTQQHTLDSQPITDQAPTVLYQVLPLAMVPTTTPNNGNIPATQLQDQSMSPDTITISYDLVYLNRITTTRAFITCGITPIAITSFSIPDHRHNTDLSHHAFACLIPILWSKSSVPGSPHNYDLILLCNSKQIFTQFQKISSTTKTVSQCYIPEWDILHSITQNAQKFRSHKFVPSNKDTSMHDQRTSDLRQHIDQAPTVHQWDTKSASFEAAQLRIHQQRVPADYTQAIREAHTAPAIDEYYAAKYEWSIHTINNIMWTQHGKALLCLPQRMCKTITQFNHEWLPVNTSPSINAIGTGRLCPYCATCDEDQQHFLSCSHPHLSKQWHDSAVTVKSKLTTYDKHTHHHLIQLIGLAITSWRTTSRPPVPTLLHPQFHQLFHSQAQIGWDHIIKGRFSKRWRHHLPHDRDRTSQDTYNLESSVRGLEIEMSTSSRHY